MIGSSQPRVLSRPMRFLALLLLFAAPLHAQVLPWAVGQTRGGIPVVAVGAPASPWGVVQLHVRLSAGDLSPAERQSVDAALTALADGAMAGRPRPASADAADVGGKTTRRIGADHAVLSEGAPMERFDLLLKLVDERLRARARILPATRRVDTEPTADPALDPRALALALPGHPTALPASGATGPGVEAPAIRAVLDQLLRRDRIVLAVVGPEEPTALLARVLRLVAAPLPPGNNAPLAPPAIGPGTRLIEATGDRTASTLWMVGPGRGAPGASPEQRAARAVLARMLGGRVEGTDAVYAIALDVDAPRPSGIARAERKRLQALVDVARSAPPAEVVERLRTQERADRLKRLTDPAAIADALGRALLAGDAGLVDKELAALATVTPDAVAREARLAGEGPRIVARTLGASK